MRIIETKQQYLDLLEERGLNNLDFKYLMPIFSTCWDDNDNEELVMDFHLNVDTEVVIGACVPVNYMNRYQLSLNIIEQNCNKGLMIKLLTNALNSVMPANEFPIRWAGRYNIYDDCFIMEAYEYIAEKDAYENTYIHPSTDLGIIIDSIILNSPELNLTKAQFAWIETAYSCSNSNK